MNQQTLLYSRTIDFLRFPLAVLIILLHNNPLGIQFAMMFFLYLGKLLLCVGIVSAISSAATFLSACDIKVPSLLPKSSFFIYLSHTLLFIIIVRLWMTIVPHTQSMLMLEYFLVPIVVVPILLMVYKLMSRYTLSILKLLNSGRI